MRTESNVIIQPIITTVLKDEHRNSSIQLIAYPDSKELYDVFSSRGLMHLTSKVTDEVINKGWLLSAKTPWIDKVAAIEVSCFDEGVNVHSFINLNNIEHLSRYEFAPLDIDHNISYYRYDRDSGVIKIRFCNTSFLYNVVLFMRVSVDAGYRLPRKGEPYPPGNEEGYPNNINNLQFSISRNNNESMAVKYIGGVQVIMIYMGELLWPGEIIELAPDYHNFKSWTFYDAKIIELG